MSVKNSHAMKSLIQQTVASQRAGERPKMTAHDLANESDLQRQRREKAEKEDTEIRAEKSAALMKQRKKQAIREKELKVQH